MAKKPLALFLDGSAKVRLFGEARWVNDKGEVVERQSLDSFGDLTAELDPMPIRFTDGDTISIRFSFDLPK